MNPYRCHSVFLLNSGCFVPHQSSPLTQTYTITTASLHIPLTSADLIPLSISEEVERVPPCTKTMKSLQRVIPGNPETTMLHALSKKVQYNNNVNRPRMRLLRASNEMTRATNIPNARTKPRYYLAPGGGCEVLFSPGLSVCLCVCVCVSVCVCVRPIFWYFISQLLEEISIWNLCRIFIGWHSIHRKILTFIGQRSRSQGRYIAFWRYSHIIKTEP